MALTCIAPSCRKAPINGDLDGMWQVMEVYPEPAQIIIDKRLYYKFYLHVCSLSYYGGTLTVGNMRYNDKTIWLDFPNGHGFQTIEILKQYGIYSNPVEFKIEHLDKRSLVMSSGDVTVILRKF